jgi:hypothetical protein
VQVFEEVIADALQEESYDDSVFEFIPPGSFVIFDDIELWWQRSENGLVILDRILKIIAKFRNRIFFILNINTYGLKVIEKLIPLNSYLLGVIKLNPIPVNSLKNMIMLRHDGTGLDLVYKNKKQEELSALKMADLFVKLYKFSSGNPGVALAAWITGIIKFENDKIWIEPAELPRTEIFDHIQSESVLLILQLFVHRQMTLKRLANVLGGELNVIERQLQFLWRMGMIAKLQNDIYEINICWYPVLKQYLVNKNYI